MEAPLASRERFSFRKLIDFVSDLCPCSPPTSARVRSPCRSRRAPPFEQLPLPRARASREPFVVVVVVLRRLAVCGSCCFATRARAFDFIPHGVSSSPRLCSSASSRLLLRGVSSLRAARCCDGSPLWLCPLAALPPVAGARSCSVACSGLPAVARPLHGRRGLGRGGA